MPARSQHRRSHEEWQRLITEQQQSGLSQRAFCREHGLALSSFRNWKQRLAATHPVPETGGGEWLELPLGLDRSTAPHWEIELDLGNGICLRLRQR